MERSRRSNKRNVYEREANVLKEARELSVDETISLEEKEQLFKELCVQYEDLLDQCKLITKVSDRLQKKINTANEKLEEKNVELQLTIDALTKARVGRKAATFALIIAGLLFLIIEGLIEPSIEDWAVSHNHWGENTVFYTSLGIKLVLALLIKPIEMIVERTMLKRVQRQETDKAKGTNKPSMA